MRYIFFITCCHILLITVNRPANGQAEIAYLNQQFQYNPDAEVEVSTAIAESDSFYHVFFEFVLAENLQIDQTYKIWYRIQNTIDQKTDGITDTINFANNGLWSDKTSYVLKTIVKKSPDNNILTINLKHIDTPAIYHKVIVLNHEIIFPYPDFFLTGKEKNGIPIFKSYISRMDTLQINEISDNQAEYHIYFYSSKFEIADPPMYLIDREISRSLSIDSTFTLLTGQKFVLNKEGFYFIQKDTSGFIGIPIRLQDQYFPKMTSIDDLYEAVIYLSTKRESVALQNAEEKKQAFDKFWLNIAKSPEKASRIIRNYYNRVETANKLFTGYKEGWKTDMGMIYIILGAPDIVYNNVLSEDWYYEERDQLPGITFSFYRIKNLFSRYHYVLIRSDNYKGYWFQAIEKWRRGLN